MMMMMMMMMMRVTAQESSNRNLDKYFAYVPVYMPAYRQLVNCI